MRRNDRGQKRASALSTAVALAAFLALHSNCLAGIKQLQPGFNLFTPQQDVELGKEAAAEMERQLPLLRNADVDRYLNVLLRRLEQSRYARSLKPDGSRAEMFPFQIRAVASKTVNAFSLPGGPIFVNSATVAAAENEAQLAGVIAHEMSHIVLRHPTNQASKRNLVALPALLAGALAGHSLLGQLAQIGVAFTANSALLKFSRTDEAEADYNGVLMMADAGYSPREMSRFFEILEAKTRRGDALSEFLSDHPNPGNRVAAIEEEIRELPRRNYATDETGQFAKARALVARVQPPARRAESGEAPTLPDIHVSTNLRSFTGSSFSLSYPDDWEVHSGSNRDSVTIAPHGGIVQTPDARSEVGYGIEVSYSASDHRPVDLERDTDSLIRGFQRANAEMRLGRAARRIQVAGETALLSTLYSRSPYRNEREVDVLVTVARPQGLFYAVFIAPESQFDAAQKTFEKIVGSIRFE
jgi:beta-barrel assembly-enhancing protease